MSAPPFDDRRTGRISWSGLITMAVALGLFAAAWTFWSASESSGVFSKIVLSAVFILVFLRGFYGVMRRAWRGDDALQYKADSNRPQALTGHRMRVVQPGVVYLLIMTVMFLGALLGRSNMLMLVFALMAGPFVINGWVIFSMLKRLYIHRHLSKRAMAGDPVFVEITLENRKKHLGSWLMAVKDRVAHSDEALNGTALFARIPARQSRSARYEFRPMRRGIYRFGPMEISTRFPLGLVERGRYSTQSGQLIVHPRLGKLTPDWRRELLFASELVEQRQLHRGVYDDEFHTLRDFRWGDNPRAIHWRTSARQSELQVREFRQSRDYDMILLLDLWQPKSPAPIDRERVELALSFAATVAITQMQESRDTVLSLTVAGRSLEKWRGQSGGAAMNSLLDRLAVVKPAGKVDLPALLESAPGRLTPGLQTIFITTRPMTELNRQFGAEMLEDRLVGCTVLESRHETLGEFFRVDW